MTFPILKKSYPPSDFSKTSFPYKWGWWVTLWKDRTVFNNSHNEKLYIFPTQFSIESLVKILQAKVLQLCFQLQKNTMALMALQTCFIYLHYFSDLFKYLAVHNKTNFMPCHTRRLGCYSCFILDTITFTFALTVINVHAASLVIIVS